MQLIHLHSYPLNANALLSQATLYLHVSVTFKSKLHQENPTIATKHLHIPRTIKPLRQSHPRRLFSAVFALK